MISPEILRRYPFFGLLDANQLRAVAMITDESDFKPGDTLLEENKPCSALYVLKEGSVDLYYTIKEEYKPGQVKEFSVGEINPGEAFGISALIEPYLSTTLARASSDGCLIKIDAAALRALCEVDQRLAYCMMRQIAKVAMERLAHTRVQLAAANR